MIDIDTKDLKIGMHVSHLDRPWLETSFMFQGFRIDNDSQIKQLQSLCKTVKVDEEQSTPSVSFAAFKPATPVQSEQKQPQNSKQRFQEEMTAARQTYEKTAGSLHQVLNKFRLDNYIALPEIKTCVQGVISSVMHNPNALVLLSNLRAKRHDTATHSVNVCVFSTLFGRYLGLDHEQLTQLGVAALLHDVGETKIPKTILDKPLGQLTPEEIKLMESHTTLGVQMLKAATDIPAEVAEVAYAHHEKMDGTGYPRGLKGTELNRLTKIIAIVDKYEHLTNNANSTLQISGSGVLKSIYEQRDIDFDGALVESFIKCLGIYPVGSVVRLNNGDTGIVIAMKPDKHLLPTVMIVRDHNAELHHPSKVINLDTFRNHEGQPLLLISKVLEPKEIDSDLSDYIVTELGPKDGSA
jgi:putative nucleotidyltransferase with HDIG domain